ncbi:MAG: LON peptidase substrate-binding domain-containing protein, partial [Bacteroidota bacterium]
MFEDIFQVQGFDEESEFMPLVPLGEDEEPQSGEKYPELLPILALKNTVLFPGIVIPITVGRERSIKAINKAYNEDKIIAVLSQKEDKIEDPKFEDLYEVGTIARIVKILRMPDGTITAILQGRKRGLLTEILTDTPYMQGMVTALEYVMPSNALEFEAMVSSILDMAKQIIELSPNIPSEAMMMLNNINSHGFLLNFIASNLGTKVTEKQKILEISDLREKANVILEKMENELRLLELKDQIENKVRGDIEKQQRDYYLNQQLKTIQEELGQNPQADEISELVVRAKKKKWGEEIQAAFDKELAKLRRVNP